MSVIKLMIGLLCISASVNAFSQEEHNDYFNLEYSTNGENWSELDKVKSAGSNTVQNDYYTLHRENENSINYYRLKQVDFDGTITNHGIASIDDQDDVVLVKRINALGQEVDENYQGVVFEYYSDGSTRKIMQETQHH